MEEINTTNSILEMIKDFMINGLSQLDIKNSKKLNYQDLDGTYKLITFEVFLKNLNDLYLNEEYQHALNQCHRYLIGLNEMLLSIKENVETQLKNLIIEFEKQNKEMLNLDLEIEDKNEIISKKNIEIENLNRQIKDVEMEYLKRENEFLRTNLNTKPQKEEEQEVADTYFDENTPDLDTYYGKPQKEEVTTKKFNIEELKQNIHKRILKVLEDEELTPIHLVNPELAMFRYEELWKSMSEGNEELKKQIPDFIYNLEDYIKKPKDYFDNINIEKNE